jgi:lipopolysaccharide/colanic/teichoic acid biosynthesis glycosyltransferase
MYKNIVKPLSDSLIALIIILMMSPIVLVLTITLFVSNSGAPFFFQKRPGKKGRVFTLIKFKTMNDKKDSDGKLLPDASRLTKVGKLVRSTSFDEIPQLINVLKGDMSLIGPRPLLVKYLGRYTPEQARRHEVKPGITGWAQVNGRNAISWEEKFELDVWYVDNVSFLLDMKILWLTIKKVIKRADISSQTSATMEEFKGRGRGQD